MYMRKSLKPASQEGIMALNASGRIHTNPTGCVFHPYISGYPASHLFIDNKTSTDVYLWVFPYGK